MARLAKIWRQRWLYFLVSPAIVSTFLFSYLPIYGITLAFREYNASLGAFRSPWIEPLFSNFFFLTDREFWYVLANTVRIAALKFIISWPAPIVLALMLNEVRSSKFKRTIQTITYLPHFISWVVLSIIIYQLASFQPDSLVNTLRSLLGLQPTNLMSRPSWFIPILVVTNIFKETGWGTIIYLAAIMAIDPQLYEASIIDGAGKMQQIRYITLPGMMPTISILLVLGIPSLLSAGFDQIYNLSNPLVAKVADVSDIYILRVGLILGQFAYATALGLFFSVSSILLTLIANGISRTSGGAGIW